MSNLTLYRPFSALRLWDRELDDLLEGFWSNRFAPAFNPQVEVTEMDKEYRLTVETPGLKKGDVHVEVKDGVLRLSGEKKAEQKEKNENYSYSERAYGRFERSFQLPEHVNGEKIEAHYENGILELSIPKTEQAKPKAIEVKVS